MQREPDNSYDRWAIAVHRTTGQKLGYIPAGDRLLAEHIDRGGEVIAHIVLVTGGPRFLDRLFFRKGENYGCVIEIEKGDFDWKWVMPFMDLDGAAAELVREAKQQEKDDPHAAYRLYEQACAKIDELDIQGRQAQAWRTTRHPINRMSMLLERKGDHARALEVINRYLASHDPVGLTKTDEESVKKRQHRLAQRLKD